MTTELRFTKMQGLGNDFIVVEGPATFGPSDVARLCDRRFGVGADGILAVTRADPVVMEYWNADGSSAEMCGNGLRCVARYVFDRGWVEGSEFTVQTPIGPRGARVGDSDVEVELGPVRNEGSRTLEGLEFHLVDVGNPHAVAFVADPGKVDVGAIGARIQRSFESGTNVEFVAVAGNGLSMRVWERGVGETLACGTGMAAAAYAADSVLGIGPRVEVEVPGGRGVVEISGGSAWIRGPAEYVFSGTV